MRTTLLLVALVLLQGCTIDQKVSCVADKRITRVTIIENPTVKSTFLDAVKAAAEKQGVATEVSPSSALPKDYPYAMTYTANWTWDITMYLVYAEINVYQQGEEIGKAIYDARRGGYNMGKFVNAEEKVHELVGELFTGQKPD